MDLHKVLLFVLASIVALGVQLRAGFEHFLHLKDLFVHYVWLFLHKFLPRRRFVLDRLPKHVSFSIADYYDNLIVDRGGKKSNVSFNDLARLIFWCGRYGVEKVSVYDWMGVVAEEDNTKLLSDLVWEQIADEETGLDDLVFSVNGIAYSNFGREPKIDKSERRRSKSESENGRTLDLLTLDWRAGRRAIVEASRSFGVDVKSGRLNLDSKTKGDLATALNEYLIENCKVSAPDLLIEFGGSGVGDSTCGYPPLALRVVEIVRIPRHRGVDELTFLECLEKYSQRDRRFGK